MQNSKKILEFQGKPMYYTLIEGQWWIALKPICEAIGVSWNHQFQMLKNDKILKAVYRNHDIQIPTDQIRKMVCLPEKFVYGWLFSIRSESDILLEYKLKCYELLYDHFNGALTRRQKTLTDKSALLTTIEELESDLAENPKYTQLKELKKEMSKHNKSLKLMDQELVSRQGSFF